MQQYNFWADLLNKFQSSPDWIKALWLIVPPAFVLALIHMLMRYRLKARAQDRTVEGELVHTILLGKDGNMQLVRHRPEFSDDPPMLPLGGVRDEPDA